MKKISAGTTGTRSNLPNSGTGWVIIPADQERGGFVSQCIKKGIVSIRTEQGDFFHNVRITKDLIQEIKFPVKNTQLGSNVFWTKLPKFNVPVIIGLIALSQEFAEITQEHQKRIITKSEKGVVDLNLKSLNNPVLDVVVNAENEEEGQINIVLNNPDDSTKMNVEVMGDIDIYASKDINLRFNKNIKIELLDEKLEKKANISYNEGVGFVLLDEFENTIATKDGVIAVGNGSSGEEEFMVMGDTLKEKLDAILTAILSLTVPTALGPSGTPINAADFIKIQGELKEILSTLCKLDKQ